MYSSVSGANASLVIARYAKPPSSSLPAPSSPFLYETCPKVFEIIKEDGEVVRRTCQSPRCSPECHRYWAKMNLYGMLWSFKSKPPDHAIRLMTKGGLSDEAITQAEQKCCREIKRLFGFEYGRVREWQSYGKGRHLHLLLMTGGKGLPCNRLGDLWKKCVPAENYLPCYSAPIRDLEEATRYLVKWGKEKAFVPPPVGFKGNVFVRSRGFLGGRVKRLYQESAQAWWAAKGRG